MLTIRLEKPSDAAAREALLDLAYGPVRFAKPSERLRIGRKPARGLAFVAVKGGRIVGTVRLWDVTAGPNRPALLLGPLAVDPEHQNCGIGTALMRHALAAAARRGHRAVLLVGDLAYYDRFGFSTERTGELWLPGLIERGRLLGRELVSGSLTGARGAIRAPERRTRTPLATAAAVLTRPLRTRAA
jgi:predicted N-acetyltransferase YhbS